MPAAELAQTRATAAEIERGSRLSVVDAASQTVLHRNE